MIKDEEIKMINEKLDYYMPESVKFHFYKK